MSFSKMQAADVIFVATDDFGLDLPENATKPVAIAALVEAGITWDKALEESPTVEAYQAQWDAKKAEDERVAANQAAVITSSSLKEKTPVPTVLQSKPRPEDVVAVTNRPAKTLIKMVRENPSFQIRGYKFTQANPFALVTEADAEYLVDLNEGFHYATPKEAAEFYG